MWVWPVSIVFLQWLDAIQDANCVVAVAGMEGALASVLGGLVNKPGDRRTYFRGIWCQYEWNIRAAHEDQFLQPTGLLR